jgi:hypothetical protein
VLVHFCHITTTRTKAGQLFGESKPSGKTRWTTTVFLNIRLARAAGDGQLRRRKSDGTATGVRVAPLTAGGELYSDVVINVKKLTHLSLDDGRGLRVAPSFRNDRTESPAANH